MQHLLRSLARSIEADNHYAALALALALPDICGWIQDPEAGSKVRCIAWFEKYLQARYTRSARNGRPEHVFLNGSDFYALRCAYLHEGRDEISEQRAQQVLERFQFVLPPKGWLVHRNQMNNALQLQIDVFCQEIAEATTRFMADISENDASMRRMAGLLLIRDVNGNTLPSEA